LPKFKKEEVSVSYKSLIRVQMKIKMHKGSMVTTGIGKQLLWDILQQYKRLFCHFE